MELNMIEPDAGLRQWAAALAARMARAEALQWDPEFRKAAVLAGHDPWQAAMIAARGVFYAR